MRGISYQFPLQVDVLHKDGHGGHGPGEVDIILVIYMGELPVGICIPALHNEHWLVFFRRRVSSVFQ